MHAGTCTLYYTKYVRNESIITIIKVTTKLGISDENILREGEGTVAYTIIKKCDRNG